MMDKQLEINNDTDTSCSLLTNRTDLKKEKRKDENRTEQNQLVTIRYFILVFNFIICFTHCFNIIVYIYTIYFTLFYYIWG